MEIICDKCGSTTYKYEEFVGPVLPVSEAVRLLKELDRDTYVYLHNIHKTFKERYLEKLANGEIDTYTAEEAYYLRK